MTDQESQAGSPIVVVPNSTEQSLRDRFEQILLISEVAAASLAEQVMEVFTEKEEQAQQLTGRCPSLLEATIEELIILLEAEPIGRRKSKSWQEPSVMPLCIAHITTAYSAQLAATRDGHPGFEPDFESQIYASQRSDAMIFLLLLPRYSKAVDKYDIQ